MYSGNPKLCAAQFAHNFWNNSFFVRNVTDLKPVKDLKRLSGWRVSTVTQIHNLHSK